MYEARSVRVAGRAQELREEAAGFLDGQHLGWLPTDPREQIWPVYTLHDHIASVDHMHDVKQFDDVTAIAELLQHVHLP
eukprot:CAMPEP_0181227594 /NCGR_PEP_ID=MMETSP1096-20121128/32873_1 /TAXON_ID=156174 ORGANISM="Chrysochromulina ericina, Strain CCMP281" /NCGR_SAMPLE_ID=MMETSP1096 /ASSEMBLY_ACC=CAM_ASM_000453 /LENGTH=78 /DNA_ID=CAMNT_0023321013 /DNA_START=1626 /DNA_END=1858 /DNA_ORIENTATION=+